VTRYTTTKIKKIQKRKQPTFANFLTEDEKEDWKKQAALRNWLLDHQKDIDALLGKNPK
jgi:hypothetical protein